MGRMGYFWLSFLPTKKQIHSSQEHAKLLFYATASIGSQKAQIFNQLKGLFLPKICSI
jgi:hypothetical protein